MINRYIIFFIIGFVLTACSSATLKPNDYEMITAGYPISQIESEHGAPYDIRDLGQNRQDYLYIHRINVGPKTSQQMHYHFIVSNGVVVNKWCEQIGTGLDISTP